MDNLAQQIEYLEEAVEVLRMQNRVLSVALKGMVRGLPAELAQDVVESVQLAFEDELDRLNYEDSERVDLFHDVSYDFFKEKV